MKARAARNRLSGRWLIAALPYLWLIAFFLVPFLIVLKISLSQTAIAQPPYTPTLDLAAAFQHDVVGEELRWIDHSAHGTVLSHEQQTNDSGACDEGPRTVLARTDPNAPARCPTT